MRHYQYYFILAFLVLISIICVFVFIYFIPARASLLYGPPANHLSISDRIEYSMRLLSYGDELSTPLNLNGTEQNFTIKPGESVISISNRLEESSGAEWRSGNMGASLKDVGARRENGESGGFVERDMHFFSFILLQN